MTQLHRIIEGLLFAADKPLSIEALLTVFDESERQDKVTLQKVLEDLTEWYADRGVELCLLASGYQFQVSADLGQWVQRLWEEKPTRYSRAFLETLALIAYRQPITRGEISEIRGVTVSTNIIKTLLEREWVRIVGHKDVPGKPALYATTRKFLDDFGLRHLSDLPPLSEIQDLFPMSAEGAVGEAVVSPAFEGDDAGSEAISEAESEQALTKEPDFASESEQVPAQIVAAESDES